MKLMTAFAAGCAGLLLLGGCSAATAANPTPSTGSPSASPGQPSRIRNPGTFGIIAAIDGATLQVQGSNGQTAVTHTDATTFTQQRAGTTADLTTGVCVTIRGTDADDVVRAETVAVTPAQDGQCSGFGGMPGGNGQRPEDAPGGMPSGFPSGARDGRPSGMPSARPDGQGGRGGQGGFGNAGDLVTGTLASIDGRTLTVTVQRPGESTETTRTVALTDATAITTTAPSSADALAVGLCAFAAGTPDKTGAVTATAIRLSDAVDGACTVR